MCVKFIKNVFYINSDNHVFYTWVLVSVVSSIDMFPDGEPSCIRENVV